MPSFAIGLVVSKAVIQPLAKAGFIKVWPGASPTTGADTAHLRPPKPPRALEWWD
jgi:hypothetical protein